MKEAPSSYETSVLTRATRRNNPEDTILHSHRRENLKSYTLIHFTSTHFGPLLLLQGCRFEETLTYLFCKRPRAGAEIKPHVQGPRVL
jgi:hypothetical protein